MRRCAHSRDGDGGVRACVHSRDGDGAREVCAQQGCSWEVSEGVSTVGMGGMRGRVHTRIVRGCVHSRNGDEECERVSVQQEWRFRV